MTDPVVDRFWCWFAGIAGALAADPIEPALIEELDRRVGDLGCPEWEVGPGDGARWFLALSPGRDPERVGLTRALVAQAPQIPGWEFLPWRPRKDWDLRFELEDDAGPTAIDARDWQCVVYRYPDGMHDIVVLVPETPPLSNDDRALAAQIVAEGQLGEELFLTAVNEVEAVTEWSDDQRVHLRPVADLRWLTSRFHDRGHETR